MTYDRCGHGLEGCRTDNLDSILAKNPYTDFENSLNIMRLLD